MMKLLLLLMFQSNVLRGITDIGEFSTTLLLLLLHVMLSTEVPEHSNCRLVPY